MLEQKRKREKEEVTGRNKKDVQKRKKDVGKGYVNIEKKNVRELRMADRTEAKDNEIKQAEGSDGGIGIEIADTSQGGDHPLGLVIGIAIGIAGNFQVGGDHPLGLAIVIVAGILIVAGCNFQARGSLVVLVIVICIAIATGITGSSHVPVPRLTHILLNKMIIFIVSFTAISH